MVAPVLVIINIYGRMVEGREKGTPMKKGG